MVKLLGKIIWFAFGAAGLIIIAKQYLPAFSLPKPNPGLVEGVQSAVVNSVTPQQTIQSVGNILGDEATKIFKTTTEEVKKFPAQQVRKIKIGACEQLLEEDICAVVKELKCP